MAIYVVHNKKVKDHVYIGRPSSVLANPYKLEKGAAKGSTLPRYKIYFYGKLLKQDKAFIAELNRLIDIARHGDLNLGCWCAPGPCHGDIIKDYIEKQLQI